MVMSPFSILGSSTTGSRSAPLAALAAVLLAGYCLQPPASAFPPALPHTFYGMIRDEFGNPLQAGATIVLESDAGVRVHGAVAGLVDAGVNYRLRVPLDAGLYGEAYKPTALQPRVPFKIRIKIGNTVYLPIEMSHDFANMGEPGKSTRLDLTLGVDSNGDGLPDAWQRRIHADIDSVKPDEDSDRDGLSNLQEYLAGTYAYDTQSGFTLRIVRSEGDLPVLAFTAITGRTYTVLGSTDLVTWVRMKFRSTSTSSEIPAMDSYASPDVRTMEVEVVPSADEPVPTAFKLMLE